MEGSGGAPADRRAIHCARCGATIRVSRPRIRWCPTCGVFLCESCSRASHGDGERHRLRRNLGILVLLFLVFGLLFAPITAYVYALDQQDLAKANLPVTAIRDLVVGSIAKINGTIEAPTQVVLNLVGIGDSASWRPSPFNVSDSTGPVAVDATPLNGSSSYRVIERGLHDDDWWNGDPISVIGEVRARPNGTAYVVAQYIARSPTLFYRPSFATPILAAFGIGALAATAVIGYVNVRRKTLHRQNEPQFPFKIHAADVCRDCGAALPEGTLFCPSCGRPTGMKARPSATGTGGTTVSLPTLRLERRFSERSPAERAGVILFGIFLPAVLLVAGAWLALGPYGLGRATLYLLIFGVVIAGVVGRDYLTRETVVLSPDRIETRRPWKTVVVDPAEVDLVLTMHRKRRSVHMLLTRGDEFVGFGPGVSPQDFEKGREWLRGFAAQRGLEYKDVDVREAIQLIYRRTKKTRRFPR